MTLTSGLAPGIHDIPADAYHCDPAAQPSLSASVAAILTSQSPAHARAAHPRLNPALIREEKASFDLGTAVHQVLLEGLDAIEIVEKDSWRTNAAKEQAAYAREQGRIPLLEKENERVVEMVAAARRQILEHEAAPPLLGDGTPEVTLVWDEGGFTCRARLDWLRDDYAAIDDVKTTARGGDPKVFERRTIYDHGYDVKAAFYLRGVRAVTGVDATFRWIVIETVAPFVLTVVTPGPDVLALGDDKVEHAIRRWKHCLTSDEWPGYTRRVARAEMPAWAETQWLERRDAA